MDTMKVCTRCGVKQPLDKEHFALGKRKHLKKDGTTAIYLVWQSRCRQCTRKYISDYGKKVGVSPARRKASQKRKSSRSSYDRVYKQNHPQYGGDHKSRALKYGVRHAPYSRKEIIERDRRTCYLCGKFVRGLIHLDHIIPLSRGGSDTSDNVRVTCPKCNLRKGSKVV